jgi:hypothetical protein
MRPKDTLNIRGFVQMNHIKERFLSEISSAIKKAGLAPGRKHPVLQATSLETIVGNLFTLILPPEVGVGTGKITDYEGRQSDQIDVILYSRNILPPIMEDPKDGTFPIESVLYTVEVKSRLTAKTLKEAFANARSLTDLKCHAGRHFLAGKEIKRKGYPTTCTAFFAFGSDLKSKSEQELVRYKRISNDFSGDSLFTSFCIVGKGYWWVEDRTKGTWKYGEASGEHIEVQDFLTGVTNILPHILSWRGRPQLDGYFGSLRGFKTVS